MKLPELAERYFAGIRARDIDALMALYAEDAVFTLPDGRVFSGTAAIRQMHASVFAASAPIPAPVGVVTDGLAIAVQVEAHLPDGTRRHTANFFQLDGQGLIKRLTIYRQGK